jgi:YggT family protein
MDFIFWFVYILTQILWIAILARALLSWFPMGNSLAPVMNILFQITEPVLAPQRQIIPRFGMLDLTPLVAMILLQLMGSIVARSL